MAKRYSQKVRTFIHQTSLFPISLVIFLVIAGSVAYLGKKYTLSQSQQTSTTASPIDCSKTGINGGYLPGTDARGEAITLFSEMRNLKMGWYMGLMRSRAEGSVGAAINTIDLASQYSINVIIRICDASGIACDWDTDYNGYVSTLNEISDAVGGKDFWAVAGHNEPNGAEPRSADSERNFMMGVIQAKESGTLAANIHLLAPTMDLHYPGIEPRSFKAFLQGLGAENLERLDGVSGNAYDIGADTLSGRISEFNAFRGSRKMYITETSYGRPDSPGNFERFKTDYRQIASASSDVEAALFYRPKEFPGLALGDGIITHDQIKEVIEGCSQSNNVDFNDSNIISECVFNEPGYDSCETEGSLSMNRNVTVACNSSGELDCRAYPLTTNGVVYMDYMKFLSDPRYTYSNLDTNPYLDDTIPTKHFTMDYVNAFGFNQRADTNSIYDSSTGDTYYVDFTKAGDLPGMIFVMGPNHSLKARPAIKHGGALYIAPYGVLHDPFGSGKIARELLVDDPVDIDHELADVNSEHISYFAPIYTDDKRCEDEFDPIEGIIDHEGSKTWGQESVVEYRQVQFDLVNMIANSALANTIKDSACVKDEESRECLVGPDSISACNPCTDILDEETGEPTGDKECVNIKWDVPYPYEILNEDALVSCIRSQQLYYRYSYQADDEQTLRLPSGISLLDQYLRYLKLMTDDPICINTNVGGRAEIGGRVYDLLTDCSGFSSAAAFSIPNPGGGCTSDPPFDAAALGCTFNESLYPDAVGESTSYFHYLGVLPYIANYMATVENDPAVYDDLPYCADAVPDDVLCRCDEGQIDPFGAFVQGKQAVNDDLQCQAYANGTCSDMYEFLGPEFEIGGGGITGPCEVSFYLPFEGTHTLTQGWYSGPGYSHNGQAALDFGGVFPALASAEGRILRINRDGYVCVDKNPAPYGDGIDDNTGVACKDVPANYVTIAHDQYGVITHYLHFSSISADLQEGQIVPAGKFLGTTGTTGWSTGNHLHFHVSSMAGCSSGYCWADYANYCFVEYPTTNWADPTLIQQSFTSQNTRVD